jgi:hypothetical protein
MTARGVANKINQHDKKALLAAPLRMVCNAGRVFGHALSFINNTIQYLSKYSLSLRYVFFFP